MKLTVPRDRLAALFAAAAEKRVVVIGDAMLDVYVSGDVERISPEAPVPIFRVRGETASLGGAANVAQNVVAVGAHCDLVSAIGSDDSGRMIAALLSRLNADHALVTVSRRTTRKTRLVARSQQIVRIDEEEDGDLQGAEVHELRERALATLEKADALVLEDYDKGVLVPDLVRQVIDAAVDREIPVIVDPKYRHFFAYRGATVFKPNLRELESALGAEVDVEHPAALPATLSRLGVANLILTLGERGMLFLPRDGEAVRIPTAAREVFDVVGAGDTVTAYLATMLAAGSTVLEAAIIANLAAGIGVGKLGAVAVRPDEVLALLGA